MLRCVRPALNRALRMYSTENSQGGSVAGKPVIREQIAKRKELSEVFGEVKDKSPVQAVTNQDEIMDISGVPEEHQTGRRAQIYRPARNSMQAGWDNASIWKIELDLRERWENPCIGYASSADPLSNISMQLDFPSEQDAIAFCEKNNWPYTVERAHDREIKPKAYGSNFHWSKRTRVGTK